MCVQLEFLLEEKTFEESITEEMKAVKTTCDKVRKSNFASIGELKKKVVDLNERLAIIERNICRGKGEVNDSG